MKEKIEVYQGEDLVFRLTGNEHVNLDDVDFTIAFTQHYCCKIMDKEKSIRVKDNVYECVVSAKETAVMPVGMYDVEMRIRKDYTRIAKKENVLLIKESCYRYGR